MFGIELILAILPLVISAVEHHKQLTGPVRVLVTSNPKDEAHLAFYHELYDELSLLKHTLGRVLPSLNTYPGSHDPFVLTDEDRRTINARLGASADPFHNLLDRLLRSIEALISDKSIGLVKLDEYSTSGAFFNKLGQFKRRIDAGETVTTLRDRIRFTRNVKSRTYAMARIQKENKTLERLLRGSFLPEQTHAHHTSTRRPQPTRLRRLSEPLYNKIADRWPTACENHAQHEARLCLWNCCSLDKSKEPDESLDMIVSVMDVDQDGSPWQESKILIPSEHDTVSAPNTVRFFIDGQTLPEPSPRPDPRRDIDSESLCTLFRKAYDQRSNLQIIFERGKLWQIQSRRMSLAIQKQKDVTLKDLLRDSEQSFTLKEKWILAAVLAHAALHGSNGPWMTEDWSKEHVCFFKVGPSMTPDLSRPFLKVFFGGRTPEIESPRSFFSPHTNPCLLSLGILLLEIYLKDCIESRWSESDLIDGEPNENTNLTTALRLLADTEGELYEGYRAAIKACLTCDIPGTHDDDFGKKVYEEIVSPLEQELSHGFHITMEDLQLVNQVA